MTVATPPLRLAPITAGLGQCSARILLAGAHQPRLLRYLAGWPDTRRNGRNLMIQFAEQGSALSSYAADSFDMAVLEAPPRAGLDELIGQLTRVSRRGLITYR